MIFMKNVSVKLKGNLHQYEIKIGHEQIKRMRRMGAKDNLQVRNQKNRCHHKSKVFGLYGEVVKKSLKNVGFEVLV